MGVALTFDDGPSTKYTPKLLDLLEKNQIPVTFFVVGNMVKHGQQVLRRAMDSPLKHQICNHSLSHPPHFKKISLGQTKIEILETQKLIEDVSHKSLTKIFRPPGGGITPDQRKLVSDLGFVLEGWDVDPEDWKNHDPKHISDVILSKAHDGKVILAHDIQPHTIIAMETILPALKQKFTLGTVSGLNLFTRMALG